MSHPNATPAQPQKTQDISHIPGYSRPAKKSWPARPSIPGHIQQALRGEDKDLSKVAILSDN